MLEVGQNTRITIDYSLSWEGLFDPIKHSLQFRYGTDNVLSRLEEKLSGLRVGEEKNITLSPHNAYGEVDPHLICMVSLDYIQDNPKVKAVLRHDTKVRAGYIYQTSDERGGKMLFLVKKVEGNHVSIDFNHPLAGKTLYYHVVVRDIQRTDKQEEI